jgi:hypothetical protein
MSQEKPLTLKEVFEQAFTELQTDPKTSLVAWGKANPSTFYPLAAKIMGAELLEVLETNTVNINIVKKQTE